MEDFLTKIGVLNGTVLKVIAVVSMTIDHIGYIFFPQYIWLRWLGRLAFPIFAYMIAEGCYYTRSKKKYLIMTAGIGVLCQAAMVIFRNSWNLNIMFTFALSMCLIFSLQWAVGRRDVFEALSQKDETQPAAVRWIPFIVILLCCIFADFGLAKIFPGFKIEYGFFGVILAVVIYIFPKKYQKLLAAAVCMLLISIVRHIPIQYYSLFALIPLALYSGKPGKHRMKYFFYLYYPVHLAVLWGIFLF